MNKKLLYLAENYDLVIVLDCASQERIGQDNNYFENAKYTINIELV